MKVIKFKQLKPGMTLGADVKDITGRVLLKKGNTLSQKNLNIFLKWGVPQATIQDVEEIPDIAPNSSKPPATATVGKTETEDLQFPTEIPPDLLNASKAEVAEIFQHNDLEHPVVKELFRMGVLFTVKGKPGMEGLDVC